jgi:methylthioribose-1-phosphate isomerase
MPIPTTLEWVGDPHTGFLRLLDQTALPELVQFKECRTVEDVWEAIRSLRVRGAPAIGIAAAYGVVIGAQHRDTGAIATRVAIQEAVDRLRTSRPTAVNLFWALARMVRGAESVCKGSPEYLRDRMLATAALIHREDRAMCEAIGKAGAALVPDGGGVLTHCNTGALATGGEGTALAVLYTAWRQGKRFTVFADETRPLLQGARLTAWELQEAGIPVTLICDSVAGWVMKQDRVQMAIVGADRIAANGDTANKIGTYSVALLAKAHGIPFYVAAPASTFDLSLASGASIPIEERAAAEVTHGFGAQTAPADVAVFNPAFDVTPAELLAGIITDRGVITPVTAEAIRERLR